MTKREYVGKALSEIQRAHDTLTRLYQLGIEVDCFDNTIVVLIESIASILTEEEKRWNEVKDMVEWWLYENVDKKIWEYDACTSVEGKEDFINWLFINYTL
jgi:hypothetical protein